MREKQTTYQNQLAEGDVGNIHTLTHTHTHTHTHTSLTPRRVLLVMSPSKRRYSISPSPSQYSCSNLTCQPAATARKMNHKCLVRNQRRHSAKVWKHTTRLFGLSSQTVTHLSLEERNAGHVKCLGKLLCITFPGVETSKVLEVVGQVQLLLTGTGWLSLVNSRLANRANKQLKKRANSSHLAGNLKPNLINGFINLVQVLLRKPCATAKAE